MEILALFFWLAMQNIEYYPTPCIDESDDEYDEEYDIDELQQESLLEESLSVADLLSLLDKPRVPEDPLEINCDFLDDAPRKSLHFAPQAWDENFREEMDFPQAPPPPLPPHFDSFNCQSSFSDDIPAIEDDGIHNWRFSHCAICYDDMKEPCILECGHFFCLPCLEQFLRISMDSGTLSSLACPDLSCGRPLSDFDIRCILPTHEYRRYSNISNTSYTKRRKDEVWCPQLDCSGCAKNKEDEQWLQCSTCTHTFCRKCRNPPHEGSSCSKAKKRAKSRKANNEKLVSKHERSTKKWASKNTKPCPRCSEIIQKNGGCHHVSCTTCGHQFCWLCGAPADGPFHCRGKKVAVLIGSVLLSPVLILGGAVAGGAYLVESRLVHRNRDRKDCATYEPVKRMSEKISLEIYWLVD